MSQPVTEYSRDRVGAIWTAEDHAYLLHHLERIERLSAEVYARLVRQVDGQKQRVYEAVEPCRCRMAYDGKALAAGEEA